MSSTRNRKRKVIFNFILIAVLILLMYIFLGCPAFTPTQQFRREEKANGVGPAEILDTISLEEYSYLYPYDQMIIAESDHGATVFCYDSSNLRRNELTYRSFAKEETVFAVPSTTGYNFSSRKEASIPILVFDDVEAAQRAEMRIFVNVTGDAGNFQKEYFLNAERQTDGYILFTLSAMSDVQLGFEGTALNELTRVNANVSVPVEISYYDRDDNLITMKKFSMRSIVGETKNTEKQQAAGLAGGLLSI